MEDEWDEYEEEVKSGEEGMTVQELAEEALKDEERKFIQNHE